MRPKTRFINARIDPGVKERAEQILQNLGVKPTRAINILISCWQKMWKQNLPGKNEPGVLLKKPWLILTEDEVEVFLQHATEKSNISAITKHEILRGYEVVAG